MARSVGRVVSRRTSQDGSPPADPSKIAGQLIANGGSSSAWGDLARVADGLTLREADAALVESGASIDCVLPRAAVLTASGRIAAGHALRRRAWTWGRSRGEQIELTVQACAQDEEFLRLVESADAARDRGDRPSAERDYERALELYPMHPGYRVQYAHTLKDQDRFQEAEIHYRTALALGAPEADVQRHLQFVTERQDYTAPLPTPPAWRGGMQDPPTVMDVDTLGYLAFRLPRLPDDQRLDLLRRCVTCEEVLARLIDSEAFRQANMPFLQIMAARR